MNIYNGRAERGTESCSNISSKGETGTERRRLVLNPWPLSQDNSHLSRGSQFTQLAQNLTYCLPRVPSEHLTHTALNLYGLILA